MIKVDSVKFLKPQWFCWKMLGVASSLISNKLKLYYYLYSLTINFMITFLNPLHFMPVLFGNATQSDDIRNLSIAVVCVSCSIKLILYSRKLSKLNEFEKLLRHLDARVKSNKELAYWNGVSSKFNIITYAFIITYAGTILALTVVTGYMLQQKRMELAYPAWFPFDWRHSLSKLYIAQLYNIFCIMVQVIQNFVNDSFPVTAVGLVSTHVNLLCIRLSQLGQQPNNHVRANEEELYRCILDQKVIYAMFDILQDIISLPLFVQFSVSAFNVCLALAALMFYLTSPMEQLYFGIYLAALCFQSFPVCYFGSELEMTFNRMPYALFSSNWTEQSHTFKRNMMLFTERSLRTTKTLAGYIIEINLDTFFAVCKGTYSLLAVVVNMNK